MVSHLTAALSLKTFLSYWKVSGKKPFSCLWDHALKIHIQLHCGGFFTEMTQQCKSSHFRERKILGSVSPKYLPEHTPPSYVKKI